MISKPCSICGKIFIVDNAVVKKGEGKYCSKKCYGVAKIVKKVKKCCPICGKYFNILPSRIKRGDGKYCSAKCSALGRRTRRLVHCKTCGKEMWIIPAYIKKYCSIKCRGIGERGELNHRWNGGNTSERAAIRNSAEYSKWRINVFKRDGYICQKCGAKGGLNAHHIKKFSIMLNDIEQKYPLLKLVDIAANQIELWDVSNGITLCKKCHKKEHSKENVCS